jgi:hypothetical protein
MTECTGQQVLFSIRKRKVTAVFDEGLVTSDAGVLFLRGADLGPGLYYVLSRKGSGRRPGTSPVGESRYRAFGQPIGLSQRSP